MSQGQVRAALADDPALSLFTDLTDLDARSLREPAEGVYIAEGLKVVSRAVTAGHRPLSALTTPRWVAGMQEVLGDQVPIHVGDESMVKNITGYRVHRGALVAFARPTNPDLPALIKGARQIVVLEDLKEHANVGAIVRSAAAFGVDAMVVSPNSADPLYRRSIKVSMGTVFTLPWCRVQRWPDELDVIADSGIRLAALTPSADAPALADFVESTTAPIAWVLGTEGPGLSDAALSRCTDRVRIPMRQGVDSLNVGAAAAVAFYAASQRSSRLNSDEPQSP